MKSIPTNKLLLYLAMAGILVLVGVAGKLISEIVSSTLIVSKNAEDFEYPMEWTKGYFLDLTPLIQQNEYEVFKEGKIVTHLQKKDPPKANKNMEAHLQKHLKKFNQIEGDSISNDSLFQDLKYEYTYVQFDNISAKPLHVFSTNTEKRLVICVDEQLRPQGTFLHYRELDRWKKPDHTPSPLN